MGATLGVSKFLTGSEGVKEWRSEGVKDWIRPNTTTWKIIDVFQVKNEEIKSLKSMLIAKISKHRGAYDFLCSNMNNY